MSSTGIINATLVAIQVGGTKISNQMSAELSISMEPRESLNKDSGGWRNRFSGAKSWEMSGEAEFAPDAAYDFETIFQAFLTGDAVAVEFTTDVSGDKKYHGNALFTSLSKSAGVEENISFSYTLSGSGAIASATVS